MGYGTFFGDQFIKNVKLLTYINYFIILIV